MHHTPYTLPTNHILCFIPNKILWVSYPQIHTHTGLPPFPLKNLLRKLYTLHTYQSNHVLYSTELPLSVLPSYIFSHLSTITSTNTPAETQLLSKQLEDIYFSNFDSYIFSHSLPSIPFKNGSINSLTVSTSNLLIVLSTFI